MDAILFLKGMLCGVAIAAPVGPVGILTAKRTLSFGKRAGTMVGLGAACADTIFGVIAAFGLHFVSEWFLANALWLRGIGGALMILVAVWILRHPPREDTKQRRSIDGMAGDFAAAFALTITNPMTILSFGWVFVAADAVVNAGDIGGAWTLIAGVFAGSFAWFLCLMVAFSTFRHRFSIEGLQKINRYCAWLIALFGVLVLFSLTPIGQRLFGYTVPG